MFLFYLSVDCEHFFWLRYCKVCANTHLFRKCKKHYFKNLQGGISKGNWHLAIL